jgi:chromatin assembly factor 1 subunit B
MLPSTDDKKEKRHLFADELTVGSFFRRLAFTPDGAFLIVPAALWHGDLESSSSGLGSNDPACPKSFDKLTDPSFGTYLFVRHCFERPYKVLAGLEKVSST